MKSNLGIGGVSKKLELVETGLLAISVAGFKFVGRKRILQLASIFQEKPEVVEAAYIRALARGEKLPMIVVGCGYPNI